MSVRRGFLYSGVFLLAAGGVVLLAQVGVLDEEAVAEAVSLWPLAVIAAGVGLLLRRTRARVPGGLVAAAMPGLLVGAMIVAVPDLPDLAGWATPCGEADPAAAVTERDGQFGGSASVNGAAALGGSASVDVALACGDLVVTTGPGSAWHFASSAGRGDRAVVTDTADRLAIRSADGQRTFAGPSRGDAWRLVLPTGTTLELATVISAGKATLDLSGAHLGTLRLDVNAGDASLDLDGAAVSRLSITVNAAKATVRLPATGDLTADLSVNAGSLLVCAPSDLGLRIRGDASLATTTYNGLVRSGDAWESPAYATTKYHADVTVSANVGSVVVNPREAVCEHPSPVPEPIRQAARRRRRWDGGVPGAGPDARPRHLDPVRLPRRVHDPAVHHPRVHRAAGAGGAGPGAVLGTRGASG